jgi:hypothetical protein
VAEYTIDPFSAPPAGHSLTEDNSKWPWGNPPQKQELFKLLMIGVSVEAIVEGAIFQGFTEGLFTPDVGLLIKGPLGIIIADMAEEEDVPYRMFENDAVFEEGEMDDETFVMLMKENNPKMFGFLRESLNMSIREGSRRKSVEKGFLSARNRETDQ